MQLIIKPTGRCNFNCKFCSASDLNIYHPVDNHVPSQLKEFIKKIEPDDLIITGGEPLMMDPSFYYELHEFWPVNMSATTNLKDFYFHPDKWAPLFKESWFNLATSFNYGDTRMWDADTVYSEEMFSKVIELYCNKVEHIAPQFLTVIDWNNEDTMMDHVMLAKRLNTQVRLNPAIGVGRQGIGNSYPIYKMYKFYIELIDKELDMYEINTSERKLNMCPRNIGFDCNTLIRCCYLDPNMNLHVSICDEQLSLNGELSE
jgi:sulfatase maturation enzyme AslB (radical SAM superfamily)